MPYIKKPDRQELDSLIAEFPVWDLTPGELNYIISKLCDHHLGERPRYTAINEVMGVLECAKLELYRRIGAPYEDVACAVNGDVYAVAEQDIAPRPSSPKR